MADTHQYRGALLRVCIALPLLVPCVANGQEFEVGGGEMVVINCPEQVELQVMVDYVGRTLDLRFLYGEQLKNQRVELRPSPVEIPKERLLDLLASLLRMRGLAMVEQTPGFVAIVKSDETSRAVSTLLPAGTTPAPDSAPRRLVWVELGDQSPRPPGIFRVGPAGRQTAA